MTNTERHLRLVTSPAPRKTRKVSGDCFRTERAQDMFRARWNAYQVKQAKLDAK